MSKLNAKQGPGKPFGAWAKADGAPAPLSTSFVMLVAAFVCLATLAGVLKLFEWGPVRWAEVSAAFRQATIFAGPAAGLGGVFASRVFHMVVCGTAPGRTIGVIVSRHLAVLLTAGGLGYLVGLAPVVILALARATAGGPDLVVMASGLAEFAAWAVLGYWVGSLVRFPYSLVAWVGAALLIWWLPLAAAHLASSPDRAFSTASVASWWDFTVPVGWHETAAVALLRACLFTSLALAAGLAAARVARPLVGVRWRDLARLMPPAAGLPAALAVCALAFQPTVIAEGPERALACEERGSVAVCVDREVEALAAPMAAVAAEAVERFGPGEFDSQAFSENASGYSGQSLHEVRAEYSQIAALEIVGFGACLPQMRQAAERGDRQIADGPAIASLLAEEIARRLNGQGPAPRYLGETTDSAETEQAVSEMSDQDLQEWIAHHRTQLASCSARPQDMLP
ncbi:MAG: hypothetical protein LBG11_00670 [Bifidobacteriaceae bacterium]|jgi:hypothetical protein|nr:hypothetical protein [Bifidobacteriaceae bacterium]